MLRRKVYYLAVSASLLVFVGIAAAQSVRLAKVGLGDSKSDVTRELGPGYSFETISVTNVPNLEWFEANNVDAHEWYTIDLFEGHVFGFEYHKNFDHPALVTNLVESITSKTWPLSGQGPSNSYLWQTDASGKPLKGNPCWTDYWRGPTRVRQVGSTPQIKPYAESCGIFIAMWDAANRETTSSTVISVLDEKVMNKVVVAARSGMQQQHEQQMKQAQKQGSPF